MAASRRWPQIKNLASPGDLRARLAALDLELPVDDEVVAGGPLAQPIETTAGTAPNRWAILPMEGWDATTDGRPTDLLRRRWHRFAASGAGLLWGMEAVAVDPAGRANPNQLAIGPRSGDDLTGLRALVAEAAADAGQPPPVVGLQLTHSGRWSRPEGSPAPRTAYEHPVLDRRLGVGGEVVLADDELERLVDRYVHAARLARAAGFDFVDVKACHGYLLHETLSASERTGPHGGELAHRTALLRRIVAAVAEAEPDLAVGVRLSLFDLVPWRAGADGVGEPEPFDLPYRCAFGGDGTTEGIDLTEPIALVGDLADLGVRLLCATAGSPYYVPHVQRPAYFPPSDGYQPPEDPLVGVARMAAATRAVAVAHPDVAVVASGLSYVQDHVAHVAQPLVAQGWAAFAGLGRMALSYPELPRDALAGEPLQRRAICRTFSDCTTAPRNGLVSGCYPLDPLYKDRPERQALAEVKRRARRGTGS